MKFEIKSITGSLLFEGDFSCIADAVTAAVKANANLRYADLRYANLRYADLRYADLSYANLSYADLRYANLSYADLRYADLSVIRNDFWAVLMYARNEIPSLRSALIEGRVNGSVYNGECACLIGTIANARHITAEQMKGGLIPDAARPAECFFLGINKGDTPENNQAAKLVVEWIDEFVSLTSAPVVAP